MSNVRWLSAEANKSLREYNQACEDLHNEGYSVQNDNPENGFWLVVKPHVYQQRKHPFLELVCDMDDLPKVRDWVCGKGA